MSLDDALRRMLADVVRETVRDEIRAVLAERRAPAAGPVMMRARDYAARVGLSVRTLDGRLPAEAWAGTGRMRRVVVAVADAHLLRGDAEPDADRDAREAGARAAAAGDRR